MSVAQVRADTLYAWKGPSLFVTTPCGECGPHPLTGFYFREARALSTFRLEIDSESLWLAEAAATAPERLDFVYVHPEITQPGGGGTGQSGDSEGVDAHGLPERALDIRLSCTVTLNGLDIAVAVNNRARRQLSFELRCLVDADFADIQEAIGRRRDQTAPVHATVEGQALSLAYGHQQLPFRTLVRGEGWDQALAN